MLCKFTKKDEKCQKHPFIGGDCPYNHRKREFDEKGKYISKKKGKGKGRAAGQEEDDGTGGWEEPLGYACRPCLLDSVPEQQRPFVHGIEGRRNSCGSRMEGRDEK